jgi:hypothetical protein
MGELKERSLRQLSTASLKLSLSAPPSKPV